VTAPTTTQQPPGKLLLATENTYHHWTMGTNPSVWIVFYW